MSRSHALFASIIAAALTLCAPVAAAEVSDTEVLLDRALGVEHIAQFDGGADAPALGARSWRQLRHSLHTARSLSPEWPTTLDVEQRVLDARRSGLVPIGLLHVGYRRLTPRALRAAPEPTDADLTAGRVFAAAALVGDTYRGARVPFRIDPDLVFVHGVPALQRVAVDYDDGRGFVDVGLGETRWIRYASAGSKRLRLRVLDASGSEYETAFRFGVNALAAPTPDDTIRTTGTIPYAGGVASGDGYVYLAPGHTGIVNPVVMAEGFDLDNSLDWDGLYDLLNRENLVETLRAEGYDLVVYNFDDATDYVQRNTYAFMELLQQVRSAAGGTNDMVVVGASMGGLCARLALATLEDMSIDHGCRLFIAFDTPHTGAVIPLGVQHWVDFFASQSAEAQLLLDALNSPAARQLLVYHHLASNTSGVPDPLRTVMIGDFTAVGGYPTLPRLVAVANGSGQQIGQGFLPGDQIIQWEANIVVSSVVGNVWATPDGGSGTVFAGDLFIIFVENKDETITVSGTLPWDNAPGGFRNSMAQMDSVEAPFGDIVALHPNHCFIPTISALDLPVSDPFYDIDGEVDPAALTPFDAVYYPAANQEHVAIVPENATWLIDEIGPLTVSVEEPVLALDGWRLSGAPNPFRFSTRLRFRLPRAADVELQIYGVDGRAIARLWQGALAAGDHTYVWDGRDTAGHRVVPGLYFARLIDGASVSTVRLVRMQ